MTYSPMISKPDGFQVVDTKTRETQHHCSFEILSWQKATHIFNCLPKNGSFEIVAVTEGDIFSQQQMPVYLPASLSFSLGTSEDTMESGDYYSVLHSDSDDPRNELMLNHRIVQNIITFLGLPVLPGLDTDQKSWSITLVKDRLDGTDIEKINTDNETINALNKLKWLVKQADDLFDVDLLLLENRDYDFRPPKDT